MKFKLNKNGQNDNIYKGIIPGGGGLPYETDGDARRLA